ncbi:TPA: hypothetical protein ACH3X1_010361 [Trebouxia sp. C0004]
MILNQPLHDGYLRGADQTHSRTTSILGRNPISGRDVGCHAQNFHTRQASFRPAYFGSASISCRFGNQLDQGHWQAERNVPDVRLSSKINLSPEINSSQRQIPQAEQVVQLTMHACHTCCFFWQRNCRSFVQETFDWRAQWYPVAVVNDLDPSRPHATKLLGDDYVLMRDADKVWRCLEDKCSHRLAPLSQGRIEPSDSTLMCSYHGWRFNGEGHAVSIPQAHFQSLAAEQAACNSTRSCVKSYPTQVQEGLLFIWPTSGPESFVHSSAVSAAGSQITNQISSEDITFQHTMHFQRDFPVPYDIVVENIGDQSHVPFAHHGVAGSRTSDWANHFKLSAVNRDLKQTDGYTYDLEWSPSGVNAPSLQHVSFTPPSLIEYVTPNEGKPSTVWFYITPLDQHNCRVFSHSVGCDPIPKPISWLLSKRPRWLDHLVLNEVFDGDMAYLHQAGVITKGQDASLDSWARNYFLASEADRSVTAWRKWYNGARGQGGPFKAEGTPLVPPTPLKREDILDRYAQHVKSCPSCSKALRGVQTGQQALQAAAAVLFLVLAAQLGQGTSPVSWPAATAASGSIVSLVLRGWLHGIEKKFTYENYDHAK